MVLPGGHGGDVLLVVVVMLHPMVVQDSTSTFTMFEVLDIDNMLKLTTIVSFTGCVALILSTWSLCSNSLNVFKFSISNRPWKLGPPATMLKGSRPT